MLTMISANELDGDYGARRVSIEIIFLVLNL
jgi:hypothetical protein